MLEGLGEALLQRIGKGNPFPHDEDEGPGRVLADYRRIKNEIAESEESIKNFEAEIVQLKMLDEEISAKEAEKAGLEKELKETLVWLGKALLEDEDFIITAGFAKQQEDNFLSKIEELEKKLEDLEEQEGGILAWIGKNAQMAVFKTLLLKNQGSLQKHYRITGTKFLESGQTEAADKEEAEKALELKGLLASLAADLAIQKGERRKLQELYSAEGSPQKRISALERRIMGLKKELPDVFLSFGSLAAVSSGKKAAWAETLSSFMQKEDPAVLEKAKLLASQIAEAEINIKRLKAAINIDEEKKVIEKNKNAISSQQQKIAAANSVIADLKKEIAESERYINELKTFLEDNKKEIDGGEEKSAGKKRNTGKGSIAKNSRRENQ